MSTLLARKCRDSCRLFGGLADRRHNTQQQMAKVSSSSVPPVFCVGIPTRQISLWLDEICTKIYNSKSAYSAILISGFRKKQAESKRLGLRECRHAVWPMIWIVYEVLRRSHLFIVAQSSSNLQTSAVFSPGAENSECSKGHTLLSVNACNRVRSHRPPQTDQLYPLEKEHTKH